MSLPPPVAVSPLIKLVRWGALIWGVYYGFTRRAELAIIEQERREEEERTREDRENYIKAEKARIEKRDLLEIELAFYGEISEENKTNNENSINLEKPFQELQINQDAITSPTVAYEKPNEPEIIHPDPTNTAYPSVADGNIMYFPDETKFDHEPTEETGKIEVAENEN